LLIEHQNQILQIQRIYLYLLFWSRPKKIWRSRGRPRLRVKFSLAYLVAPSNSKKLILSEKNEKLILSEKNEKLILSEKNELKALIEAGILGHDHHVYHIFLFLTFFSNLLKK